MNGFRFLAAMGMVLFTVEASSQSTEGVYVRRLLEPVPAEGSFGRAVAMSDRIVVVSDPLADGNAKDSGAVYVFLRDAKGTPTSIPAAKLYPQEGFAGQRLGDFVVVDGTTVAVWGGPLDDSVYVFEPSASDSTTWIEKAKLVQNDPRPQPSDWFGRPTAIENDIIAVGGSSNTKRAVYIFQRDASSGVWNQAQKLVPDIESESAGVMFGSSLALTNGTLVVGARVAYLKGQMGEMYIFERDPAGAETWENAARFRGDLRSFGWGVDIDGTTILVSDTGYGGRVHVFECPSVGESWRKTATVTGEIDGSGEFGDPLYLSANRLLTVQHGGTDDYDGRTVPSTVQLFSRTSDGTWSKRVKFPITTFNGPFQVSKQSRAAFDGQTAIVAFPGESSSGLVHAFSFDHELLGREAVPYVAADFGENGLWAYGEGVWKQWASWDPDAFAAFQNGIAAGFGPDRGLWLRRDGTWRQLSAWTPYKLLRWQDHLIAAFDNGRGLWLHDGDKWSQLTSWEPVEIVAWADRLAVAFGTGRGLWLYKDDVGWASLTTWDPKELESWASRLLVSFDSNRGTWYYEAGRWNLLTELDSDQLAAWGDSAVLDLGETGLWVKGRYCLRVGQCDWALEPQGGWVQQATPDPHRVFAWGDVLLSAFDEGVGVYANPGDGQWTYLTSWAPVAFAVYGELLVSDFGTDRGMFTYDSSAGWRHLTNWSAEQTLSMVIHR